MASTNEAKAQLISQKLNFLKDQGDRLISVVGLYVDRIIAAVESWTQGGENNLEYQELRQMLDTAAEFLCDKCVELRGGSVGAALNQLSCEEQGETTKSITATSSTTVASDKQPVWQLASTATASDKQPVAPLASTVTTSYRQSTETVQPADETQIEKGQSDLSQLIQEVAVLSRRLQQLEMTSSGTRCGFTARTRLTGEVASYHRISPYEKRSNCNGAKSFNAGTGIFTAPVDGLYVTAISLLLSENGHVCVNVQYTNSLDQSTTVCCSTAEMKGTTASRLSLVGMKAGDILYSRVYDMKNNNDQNQVYFLCFLLR